MLAGYQGLFLSEVCQCHYHRCLRCSQESRLSGNSMEGSPRGRGYPSFAPHQSGRRHGDRPGRLCRFHLQEGHQLHQHPDHPSGNGRRKCRGKDGLQLRRTEKRNRCLQRQPVCHPEHSFPPDAQQREYPFRLCRNA